MLGRYDINIAVDAVSQWVEQKQQQQLKLNTVRVHAHPHSDYIVPRPGRSTSLNAEWHGILMKQHNVSSSTNYFCPTIRCLLSPAGFFTSDRFITLG